MLGPVPPPQVDPPEEIRVRREAARRAGRNGDRSEIGQRRRRVSPGLGRRHRYQASGLLAVLVVAVGVVLLGNLGKSSAGSSATNTQIAASHTRTTRAAGNSRLGANGQTTAQTRGATTTSGTALSGKGTGRPGQAAVPILMYHVIAAPPAGAPFPGLYVVPSEFAAQMEALKRAGWHAVTLDQVQAYWQRGVSLGAGKPIVVSFDNGYQSQYTQALPVLRRLGWVADENLQLTGLPPSQGGLSQIQVKGLVAAGWELDTQGFSHADLITLDSEQLHYQVAVARSTVQQRYGVPVNWFCYPSGHYDATVIAAVEAAGYTGSTTVVPGWAHPGEDRFRLHRLRVLGETSPEALLSEIGSIREDPPAPSSYNGT
jgi:peptidoglycan/xylan/chitin deacetylase (PgdA/CDA1 family)